MQSTKRLLRQMADLETYVIRQGGKTMLAHTKRLMEMDGGLVPTC
jgi:hypothetical protein